MIEIQAFFLIFKYYFWHSTSRLFLTLKIRHWMIRHWMIFNIHWFDIRWFLALADSAFADLAFADTLIRCSLTVSFLGSSWADFTYVHCNIYHERWRGTSAFRNKKQNVSITYTTHFRAFQSWQKCIFQNSNYTVVTHC